MDTRHSDLQRKVDELEEKLKGLQSQPLRTEGEGHSLRTFKGRPDERVSDFLARFERVARAKKWHDDDWAAHLLPQLEGTALLWLDNQEEETTRSYHDLKQGLLKTFGPEQKSKLQQAYSARTRTQGLNETVDQYAYDLKRMCLEYDPDMSDLDRRVAFVSGLRASLRERVTSAYPPPKDWAETVDLARHCAQAEELGGPPARVRAVEEASSGTITDPSELAKVQAALQELLAVMRGSHPVRDDRRQTPGRQLRKPMRWTDAGEPICLACDQPGHLRRDCKARKGKATAPGPGSSNH